jgi:hypothetical protein
MSAGISIKRLSLTQQSTSFKNNIKPLTQQSASFRNKLLNNTRETHLIVAMLKYNSLPLHGIPVRTQTTYRKKFPSEALYSLTVS